MTTQTTLPHVDPNLYLDPPIRRRSRWYMTLPLMASVGALALAALKFPPDVQSRGADWIRFAGRLHPVMTHLPIGLLILMPIFDFLGMFKRGRHLWASGQLVLWLATLGTILAATSGYLLARFTGQGGHDVIDHQWAGIATAGAACFALMFRSLARGGTLRKSWSLVYLLALAFTLLCMTFAGHRGGNLTHGDTFLTEYAPEPIKGWINLFSNQDEIKEGKPSPVTPASAPTTLPTSQPLVELPVNTTPLGERTLFASVVSPILVQHCVECHGEKKSKGGLRLDTFANVIEGGESGSTVVAGSTAESELVRMIKLPRDDDDAMPPKKKAGLSPAEIDAIAIWVASGANDTLTLAQAKDVPESVRALAR